MNHNMIYDEGDGLATPFIKGKPLSQQLREEREELERKTKQAINTKNKIADYYFVKQKRAQLHRQKPDLNTKSGYFIARGKNYEAFMHIAEMPGLEDEVLKYYATSYKLTDKYRFQELIDAKRMFIFFATTYLKLTSFVIANYLNLHRSTLSHHVYAAMDEIDMYPQLQTIARSIDSYLWRRSEQLRQTNNT